MSLSDLDKVIDWLNRSKVRNVQLLGGEPMIHPDILRFVGKLVGKGVMIRTILTNGLADTELYGKVMEMTQTTWLVNINRPETYTKAEWELLNRNLEILMWKGKDRLIEQSGFDERSFSLQLAVNLYTPGQYRYIIDLAKKYDCPIIRYAPSHPSADKSNFYVGSTSQGEGDFEGLKQLKPTLMDFVRNCVCEGIHPTLECILPPCIFTTSEWRYLMLFSVGLRTICPPDIEVMPDLSVECCVSMRGKLPVYKVGRMSVSEMLEHYWNDTMKYRDYALPSCRDCVMFKNRTCQGYCLRFKADHVKMR